MCMFMGVPGHSIDFGIAEDHSTALLSKNFILLNEFFSGLLRLPRAAAGTIKVSKKTKARAATLIAKMPDDAMSLLSSAGSPTLREVMTAPREMIAKKRPHEMGTLTSTILSSAPFQLQTMSFVLT